MRRAADGSRVDQPAASRSGDGGMPAIWTFWYGYNSKIYDRRQMATGVPTNYTERLNLWILDWVRRVLPGRSGPMVVLGQLDGRLRNDLLRTAPSGAVRRAARQRSHRLLLVSGPRQRPPFGAFVLGGADRGRLEDQRGVSLLERMDSTKFVREAAVDLPMLYLVNGRQDGSIPWENNPPFYRALNDAHQAFAVYWDNGTHATCGKDAPADVKAWQQQIHRFRLDQSFPAFSNTSSNRNPGDGRPEDGDVVGWMNRGMDWKDVEGPASNTRSPCWPTIRASSIPCGPT